MQDTAGPVRFQNGLPSMTNKTSFTNKMISGMYPQMKKQSVKEEIRRMSLIVLQNMSVLDRNSLFINPKNHMEAIRSNFLREKQHFFYVDANDDASSKS